MSDFSRQMKKAVRGDDGINPLQVIGLTSEVLNLGLSEDDLYEVLVKGFARNLVVRLHPDRAGVRDRTVELQRRYAEAFEKLQDREVYENALSDFKYDHSLSRSELTRVRRSLSATNESLRQAQEEIGELIKAKAALQASVAEREESSYRIADLGSLRFNRPYMKSTQIQPRKPLIYPVHQPVGLVLLTVEYEPGYKLPFEELVDMHRPGYIELVARSAAFSIYPWLHERERVFYERLDAQGKKLIDDWVLLEGNVRRDGLDTVSVASLIKRLDNEEQFPSLDWRENNSFSSYGFPMIGKREETRFEPIVALSERLPEKSPTLKVLSARYKQALRATLVLIKKSSPFVRSLRVYPRYVGLVRGYFKDYLGDEMHILGSVCLEDFDNGGLKFGSTEPHLLRPWVRPLIMENEVLLTRPVIKTEHPAYERKTQIKHLYSDLRNRRRPVKARDIVLHIFPG